MGLLGFDNFADAFDGGGAGKSGDTFSGGPLSELLNALGIRPHGFGQTTMGDRPMPNPAYSQPRVSTSGPAAPAPSYAMVAGRPDTPMGGGMPPMPPMPAPSYAYVAGRPELPRIGQPNLTPEQMQQILMRLGLQSAGNTFGGMR